MSEANPPGKPPAPDPRTALIHHRTHYADADPSVTPLFQSSAFERGSPYFYTRKNNPNVAELEECVALIEGAAHGVALACGMAAIKVCLDIVRPGQTIVLHELVYGCTARAVDRHCNRLGITLVVADITAPEFSYAALDDVGLVLFETPTNPFLRSVDIADQVRRAKAAHPGCRVAVDNTWATSLYQQPLKLGADISLQSATKYLSGHSDVMGGLLLTDDPELAQFARDERFYSGLLIDPFAAWLLRRSLQTLAIRLEAQGAATLRVRDYLATVPEIETVYFPDIDGEQLTGYAGIVFVQLEKNSPISFEDIVDRLNYFGSGTGMACVSSMIAQPYTGSHASMTDAEKSAIGLDHGLVRLCIGLEPPDALIADLDTAFAAARMSVVDT